MIKINISVYKNEWVNILKRKFQYLTISFLVLGFVACKNSDTATNNNTNTESNSKTCDSIITSTEPTTTVVPSLVSDMYLKSGNSSSNTVVVFLIGGPLKEIPVPPARGNFDSEQPKWASIFTVASVYQSQMINPDIMKWNTAEYSKNYTMERAFKDNEISVYMACKVAESFKKQNKRVYLISHSFGSFLLPYLIAKIDVSKIADKVSIWAGRIDTPDEMWMAFRDGVGGYFDATGENFKRHDPDPNVTIESKNMNKLQASFGQNRYSKLLAGKDLVNLFYAYGEYDGPVGRLTTDEVNFLTKNKATVLKIPEGDHLSPFIDVPSNNKIFEFLETK